MSSNNKNMNQNKKYDHRSGSSVVPPETKKEEKIRRVTLGEKTQKKPNYTILLMGETGAGKSNLVNALFNYTIGVKWEDKAWPEIVKEKGHTTDVIVYEIFELKDKTVPYYLTIIDTPGYGRNNVNTNDAIVRKKIFDFFQSQNEVQVNVVGLVIQETDKQLTDRLMYIFDSMMSLFGNNVENNIAAFLTHSRGIEQNVAKALNSKNIKWPKNPENKPVYFMFEKYQNYKRTQESEPGLKKAWETTETGMKKLTEFLIRSEPQHMTMTSEVLTNCFELKTCIQNLKEEIKMINETQKKLNEVKTSIADLEKSCEEKTCISGGMWGFFYEGAVCCKVCKTNCHYPGCIVAWYPEHCMVMREGHCTVCPKKCPASDHVKEPKIYKKREEMKKMADKIESERVKKLSLEKKIKELKAKTPHLLDESYQHVVNLEQNALKADSVSTIVHLDFLIEKFKEKGETEKVQKLNEMKRGVDKVTTAALRYLRGKQ